MRVNDVLMTCAVLVIGLHLHLIARAQERDRQALVETGIAIVEHNRAVYRLAKEWMVLRQADELECRMGSLRGQGRDPDRTPGTIRCANCGEMPDDVMRRTGEDVERAKRDAGNK